MRKLQLQDTLDFVSLIKKTGIKAEIQEAVIESKKNNTSLEELGIKVLFSLIDAAGDTEIQNEIYALMGNITEQGIEDIKRMSLDGFVNILQQFKKENDLKSFFAAVKALME